MFYANEDLTRRLRALEHGDLVDILATLYQSDPTARKEINRRCAAYEKPDTVLQNIDRYTAGECKAMVEAHARSLKNRRERVLFYFDFVETVLDKIDSLDYRFLSVSSAMFGKAMALLGKDKALWDELLERSYAIAGRFYEMPGAHAYKAVEYYMRAKDAASG